MPVAGKVIAGREPLMEITVSDDTGIVDNFSLVGLRIVGKLKEITRPEHRRRILELVADDLCDKRIRLQFMREGGYLSSEGWEGYSPGSRASHPMLKDTGTLYRHLTDRKKSVGIRVKGKYGVGWTDDSLTLGFKDVGYGRWHQTGTSKMPQRAIVQFIPGDVLKFWRDGIITPYLKAIYGKRLRQ